MTTTGFTHATAVPAPTFDIEPLSWVMVEVREALGRSRAALFQAAAGDHEESATALQHARSHLHQAHGALQMVDIDGISVLTQTCEKALEQFKDGTLACTTAHVQTVAELYQALTEYLEELLAGALAQPLRLFPYYRALQQMLGATRIHPADLFFPNLAMPAAAATPAVAATAAPAELAVCRQRYEKALLPYLKSTEPEAQRNHAAALRDAIGMVADAQQQGQPARTFWFAMQTVADLVAAGQLAGSLNVKQFFGLVNLQMRRLTQGSTELPDAMLRDALYFIASVAEPTPAARQLRQAYRLDGMVPPDVEAKRYGLVDLDALERARAALAQAEASWHRLAGAAADPSSDADAAFVQAVTEVAAECGKLKLPALESLMRQLGQVSAGAFQGAHSEELGLEMATALLFAQHGLEQIRRLPDDFAANSAVIGARLAALHAGVTPPPPTQWHGDVSRQLEQEETVSVLAAEMKTCLRQVEKVLDDYYADPSKRPALAQIDPLMQQLQGVLAMLDQEDAMRAAQHVKAAVRGLAQSDGQGDAASEPQELDRIAQNVGALGFFVDMLGRNVEAAKERFHFDADAGSFRAIPFEKIVAQAPVPLDEELMPVPAVVPEPPPAVMTPAPGSDAAIEAELLEIFIAEAQEVLGFVDTTLALPREQSSTLDNMTMLRRSFHTLKGSGRMVGLNEFGEGAAAIEKVMNVWLAEARPATDDLFGLLAHAAHGMRLWVDELAATGISARNSAALVESAAQVQEGGRFITTEAAPAAAEPVTAVASEETHLETESESEAVAEAPEALFVQELQPELEPELETASVAVEEAIAEEEAVPEEIVAISLEAEAPVEPALDADIAASAAADEVSAGHAAENTAEASVAEEPAVAAEEAPAPVAAPAAEDNVKRVGGLSISLPLYNIYLAETANLLRLLAADFSAWREEPQRTASAEALHAAHTLTGSSGTVGFESLRELALALESTLAGLVAPSSGVSEAQHDLLDRVLTRIGEMLAIFARGELPPNEPELIAALSRLSQMDAQALLAPKDEAVNSLDDIEHYLNGLFSSAYDGITTPEPAAAEEVVAANDVEVAEVAEVAEVVEVVEVAKLADAASDIVPDTAAEADVDAVADEAEQIPELVDAVAEDSADLAAVDLPALEEERLTVTAAPAAVQESETPAVPVAAFEPAPQLEIAAPGAIPADELDADLLPVFLEEGADLLPRIGEVLRSWQQKPEDMAQAQALLRVLHTVKGSARMAGAMRLGQHAHEIETHIENVLHAGNASPQAFEELLLHYDHAVLLFEQLQNPNASKAVIPAPALPTAAPRAPGSIAPVAAAANPATPAAKVPLVRVRADILDRLVNQAGEVSISRSRLENEVATLRGSLAEFSENLARLRRQLREVEMQAESQISSRMAVSGEREFDPLEFDRFTRLQELTRMMAESVNDVGTFQENLARSVDHASDDLVQQARLTRDLQRDLMRVRMVPFVSISERLYRIARQSAKEVDKRVNLDIRGASVEMDRSVLERMAAPFEHMLRNAIVHGIETREQRRAAGKEEIGELLVQVSQRGNEVAIEIRDDGAGLDLERIRAKALSTGLVAQGEELDDAEAASLIFEPGFSTAASLTELAGRGVGMDIVRSEAQALGGRVAIDSERGRGTRFTIHLPLTLAVTQVVLVSAGSQTYALPATLVEQLLQIKESTLAEAHAAGTMQSQGQAVSLRYLPKLLANEQGAPQLAQQQRSSPVLLLRSGSDRLALQVDEVLGNREAVIKNIGPQLARVAGIVGATVLGSGDIVLILDPVVLARHLEQQQRQRPQLGEPTLVQSQPARIEADDDSHGPARKPVIMVVDDSMTVRRVTLRLLEREGYRVLLAKDGVDALEQIQDNVPDLMLVDIEMPRMDGFDLTRNVRDDIRTRAIPIIMITSRTADKHRNYALELGVNAYYGKPFQEAVLLEAIEGLLHKKKEAA